MSVIRVNPIGRFGNQLFQYAFARAYAEHYRAKLQVGEWIGERVFCLADERPGNDELPVYNEINVPPAAVDLEFRTYAQSQAAMLYTRDDTRRYFQFRPEIAVELVKMRKINVAGHRRVGDYPALGYPVVSLRSYQAAAKVFRLPIPEIISEELPNDPGALPAGLSFLADFWLLLSAGVLLRANSSFSWWAATLGDSDVFSPIIEGLEGGREHDCRFVRGNHPRLASLDFVTDLHLKPGFREELRYEYPLGPRSIVIDIGAHEGVFAAEISRRYGCHVEAYEPMDQFRNVALANLAQYPKVTLHPFAVGAEPSKRTFRVKGSMTGEFAEGPDIRVEAVSIDTALWNNPVDLLKLNVEGAEYEILEAMIERGLARRCRNIQVQFHGVAPKAVERWRRIRADLCATHRLTFDYPFCWENYALK